MFNTDHDFWFKDMNAFSVAFFLARLAQQWEKQGNYYNHETNIDDAAQMISDALHNI